MKHHIHCDNMFPCYERWNSDFVGFKFRDKALSVSDLCFNRYYPCNIITGTPTLHDNEIIMQLFMSSALRSKLKKASYVLYSKIRDYIDINSFTDIFFLDIAYEDKSKISYYDKYKLDKFFKNNRSYTTKELWVNHRKYTVNPYLYTYRQNYAYMGKAGRAFKKAIPTLPDDIIQEISQVFHVPKGELELWEGLDKIKYAYHEDNYLSDTGSLGASCMRYSSCQDYFDIYHDLGCKILVMVDKNRKIHGRAIVWHDVEIDDKKLTVMDRIYTHNENNEGAFIAYAKSKGWAYKTEQNYHNKTGFIIDGETVDTYAKISRSVCLCDYDYVPYIDTFTYYTDRTLSNDSNDYRIALTDTEGGDNNRGNWSEHYHCYIPEDESCYVDGVGWVYNDDTLYDDINQCYVMEEDAAELYDGRFTRLDETVTLANGKYAHQEDDEIVELDNGDLVHKDDAVWLEDEEVFVPKDSEDIEYNDEKGYHIRKAA